jgi:hypothetical protein
MSWVFVSLLRFHTSFLIAAAPQLSVPRARGDMSTNLLLTIRALGHHNQAKAGRLRRLTCVQPAKPSGLGVVLPSASVGSEDNLNIPLSEVSFPRPENQSLEPYAWCGCGQAREPGRTLHAASRSAQLNRWGIR